MKYFELNKQEKQIIADFDKGNFISVDNLKRDKAKYQTLAASVLHQYSNTA